MAPLTSQIWQKVQSCCVRGTRYQRDSCKTINLSLASPSGRAAWILSIECPLLPLERTRQNLSESHQLPKTSKAFAFTVFPRAGTIRRLASVARSDNLGDAVCDFEGFSHFLQTSSEVMSSMTCRNTFVCLLLFLACLAHANGYVLSSRTHCAFFFYLLYHPRCRESVKFDGTCYGYVNNLKGYFGNDTWVSSLSQSFMRGLCPRTPDNPSCQLLTNTIVREVTNIILDNITPWEVCDLLNGAKPTGQKVCTRCKNVAKKIIDAVNKKTTNKVKDACNSLTAGTKARKNCEKVADRVHSLFIDTAKQLTNTRACTVIGVCSGSEDIPLPVTRLYNNVKSSLEIYKKNDKYCNSTCASLFKTTYVALETNDDHDEEIQQYATKLCNLVSPKRRVECRRIRKKFGPQILRFAITQLKRTFICQNIGVCPGDPANPYNWYG